MPKKSTVVVTGFGPFWEHKVNASWSAVQELDRLGLEDEDVELITFEIAVEYETAKKLVPQLWKEYDPCLMVHVGVSGIAKELTLEQQAHNTGYDKPDVSFLVPKSKCCIRDGPDCILSQINMSIVSDEVNSNSCPTKAVVSYNAGKYLCDFVYYISLYQNCAQTAFIHVPPLGKPYSARQLGEGLRAAIRSMLKQVRQTKGEIL
ncbi:pyroglutamyl-peptidase 1-like [Acanthaster planci]|uniref:Pyroglutamyl-peptidase 1-like n=1 Tax=Acanthaster planci TaxID=133434 RepID=A0A8B7ZKU0_ACAPL|nr:pyroglutamyl-peptidase 1-like [Acanthaster planci]